MKVSRRSLAFALVGWCAALLPAGRGGWAAAMHAEVRAIDDPDAALTFAAGCVWGSVKERVFDMNFAARLTRVATIAGMSVLAAASAVLSGRAMEGHGSGAMVFALTSGIFAAAVWWSWRRGPIALVQAAGAMIPFYVVALGLLVLQDDLSGADARLYRALATEGVLIWTALLVAGLFMHRAATARSTARA